MLAAARAMCAAVGRVRRASVCGTQRCCSRRFMCSVRRAERANVMHERQVQGNARELRRGYAWQRRSSNQIETGNVLAYLLCCFCCCCHVMWEMGSVGMRPLASDCCCDIWSRSRGSASSSRAARSNQTGERGLLERHSCCCCCCTLTNPIYDGKKQYGNGRCSSAAARQFEPSTSFQVEKPKPRESPQTKSSGPVGATSAPSVEGFPMWVE